MVCKLVHRRIMGELPWIPVIALQMPFERHDRRVPGKRHQNAIAHGTGEPYRTRLCFRERRFVRHHGWNGADYLNLLKISRQGIESKALDQIARKERKSRPHARRRTVTACPRHF